MDFFACPVDCELMLIYILHYLDRSLILTFSNFIQYHFFILLSKNSPYFMLPKFNMKTLHFALVNAV